MFVYDENCDRKRVEDVELITPKNAGNVWRGIKHGNLLNMIDLLADELDWTVGAQRFSLSDDGTDLAGAFEITIPGVEVPEGQTLAMGVLTSNSMKRALKLVIGTEVACCLNGMCTGETLLKKRHTKNLELIENLRAGMLRFAAEAAKIKQTVEYLQATEISDAQVDRVLMEAGRRKLMPWSRLGKVDAEYNNPTFAEHGHGTLWALFNAFTYIVKMNPPMRQMEQINGFRGLLPSPSQGVITIN